MNDGFAPSAHVGTPRCHPSIPDCVLASSTFSPRLSRSLSWRRNGGGSDQDRVQACAASEGQSERSMSSTSDPDRLVYPRDIFVCPPRNSCSRRIMGYDGMPGRDRGSHCVLCRSREACDESNASSTAADPEHWGDGEEASVVGTPGTRPFVHVADPAHSRRFWMLPERSPVILPLLKPYFVVHVPKSPPLKVSARPEVGSGFLSRLRFPQSVSNFDKDSCECG